MSSQINNIINLAFYQSAGYNSAVSDPPNTFLDGIDFDDNDSFQEGLEEIIENNDDSRNSYSRFDSFSEALNNLLNCIFYNSSTTQSNLRTPLTSYSISSTSETIDNIIRKALSPTNYFKQKLDSNATNKNFATRISSLAKTTTNYIKETIGKFITPVRGILTSGFGPRRRPTVGASTNHKGLDIAAQTGTKVIATNSGRVIFRGKSRGYGNLIIIDHGNGTTSRYGHLSKFNISQGQEVDQGQKIAEVGSTGISTGPHLHFEIRKHGIAENPSHVIGLG